MLRAENLAVERNSQPILSGVSAAFERGTLTAVVGPNGAGKSTLLSVLAGLTKPSAGILTWEGRPIAQIARRTWAQARAYLPQNPHVDWPISVEQLVRLGLTPSMPAFGAPSAQDGAALERTLAESELTSLRSRAATSLSGGELARAMLARTLVGDPHVLIVDEPTAGLDPRHAFEACARLRRHAHAQRVVIVAMHDLDLAARYADQFLALRAGRLIAAGSARETLSERVLETLFDVPARVDFTDGACVRFVARSPR